MIEVVGIPVQSLSGGDARYCSLVPNKHLNTTTQLVRYSGLASACVVPHASPCMHPEAQAAHPHLPQTHTDGVSGLHCS